MNREKNNPEVYLLISAPDSGPICDFCSGTPVVACHQCEPLADTVKLPGMSFTAIDTDGLFAACAICNPLIQAEKWDALLERSFTTIKADLGIGYLPVEIQRHITNLHEGFRATRKLPN